MSTKFHMCQSVTGPLRNWSPKQWRDATDWITNDDGSKFSTGDALKAMFQKMANEGIEVIPVGPECDNFDRKNGCMGHVSHDSGAT